MALQPAPNLNLTFEQENSSDVHQATTDRAGRFSITLPAGTYRMAVTLAEVYYLDPGSGRPVTEIRVGAARHLIIDLRAIPSGICLAARDRISTPTGPVPVSEMRAGVIVWTLDAMGRRIPAPALLVTRIQAPPGHRVLRLVLSDGRIMEASAGHPTADGRLIGDLRPGDILDGSRVTRVESIRYVGDTWDLLPAGPTGAYWANDVLLGSTLVVIGSTR
jgi:hypothetical protein